jgi:hypothetical protein
MLISAVACNHALNSAPLLPCDEASVTRRGVLWRRQQLHLRYFFHVQGSWSGKG